MANVFRSQVRGRDGARLKTLAEEAALGELEGLLDDEGLAAARHAVLTSYYTPPEVASAVVGALAASGFGAEGRDDAALEPGCGSGTFLAALSALPGARAFGVEIDPTSAAVAAALAPGARVVCAPLQRALVAPGSFSLAVGNVPFVSEERGEDPECGSVALHDYFVLRSVRALRPGGVAALLTSSHTLDKKSPSVREALARMAEVVDAVRLPQETFLEHAATSPRATDLLVLRRRDEDLPAGELVGTLADDSLWGPAETGMGDTCCRAFLPGGAGFCVGSMAQGRAGDNGVPRAHSLWTLPGGTAADVAAALSARLASTVGSRGLAARVGAPRAEAAVSEMPARGGDGRRYELASDGSVWLGSGESWELAEPASAKGRLRGLVGLRDGLEALYALEADPASADADVEEAIAGLRGSYERFVSRFGRVGGQSNRRAWDSTADRSWAAVASLERWRGSGAERRLEGLSDCLERRVVVPDPPRPERCDTPAEALAVCLDELGRVDMGRVASLLGMDEAQARDALGDRVLDDPSGRPRLAEEWLSGDLNARLAEVDEAAAPHLRALAEEDDAWLDSLDGGAFRAMLAHAGTQEWVRSCRLAGKWGAEVAGARVATGSEPPGLWAGGHGADPAAAAAAYLRELALAPEQADPGRPTPVWDTIAARLADGYRRAHWRPLDGPLAPRAGFDPMLRAAVTPRAADCAEELAALVARAARLCPGRLPARCLESLVYAALPSPNDRGAWDVAMRLWAPLGVEPPDLGSMGRDELWAARMDHARRLAAAAAADPSRCDRALALARASGREGARAADASPGAREAFAAAWDAREGAGLAAHGAEAARLAALRARVEGAMPERLGRGDIRVSMGAPWVPADVYLDFARHVFGVGSWERLPLSRVEHSGAGGAWEVHLSDAWKNASGAAQLRWSVPRRDGSDWPGWRVFAACMTCSEIKVEDPAGGADTAATAAAQAKAAELRREFSEWAFADEGRAGRLEALYNRAHNAVAPRRYDGSRLTFPGMSPLVSLRPHQRDAVARFLQAGEGTLLAHAVGAGKTYTGIACLHEAKRLGRCSKPLVVVPAATMGGWAQSWGELYPRDRVLVMEDADQAGPRRREEFWAAVRSSSWDAVIVPDTAFDMLKLSEAAAREMRERRIEAVVADERSRKENGMSTKAEEKLRARLQGQADAQEALAARAGDVETSSFDSLGVDALLVDEAHGYKNLPLEGRIDLPGVSAAGSGKCSLMRDKVRWMQASGLGANVAFMTGTPVSNSMTELYKMESYLAPRQLRASGAETFSDWVRTFGEVTSTIEADVAGDRLRTVRRLSRFVNLPELMAAYRVFADPVGRDDLELDVPELEVVPVAVEPSEGQREEVWSLSGRADEVRAGKVDPRDDNMLKITSDGRALAISLKMLHRDDPDFESEPDGKLAAVAENVARVWRETAGRRGAQLVFSDIGTPQGKPGGWDVYSDIKARLEGLGVPAEEVAWVPAGASKAAREALFAKVRSGELRVLMGSTQTLGTGVNVQDRLAAIHNVDCPWRPSDVEQRRGRVQRQGNMFERVQSYHYVTKGTFDAYLYQTVERKQRFVAQLGADTSALAREADDIDQQALDYATIKELTVTDPAVRERTRAANTVASLSLEETAHLRTCAAARERASALKSRVESLEADLERMRADPGAWAAPASRADADKRAALPPRATVGGAELSGPDANRAIFEAAMAVPDLQERMVGTYLGLEVWAHAGLGKSAAKANAPDLVALSVRTPGGGRASAGKLSRAASGPHAPLSKVAAAVSEMAGGTRVRWAEADLGQAKADLEAARQAGCAPFPHAEELEQARDDLKRIDREREEAAARAAGPSEGGEAPCPPPLADSLAALGGRTAPGSGGARRA